MAHAISKDENIRIFHVKIASKEAMRFSFSTSDHHSQEFCINTRSIAYKKQRKIQTSHVSYFFEIFDGFCFLEIEKSWFFVS